MQIDHNTVVHFHIIAKDQNDLLLEDSYADDQPAAYLHGHSNLFPAMEAALLGKTVGDKAEVRIAAKDAYGELKANHTGRVSLKQIMNDGPIKAGDVVDLRIAEGITQATVLKKGLKMVDLDLNHPWAGKTLLMQLEVLDVRAATRSEIEHGHAHTDATGGHQH